MKFLRNLLFPHYVGLLADIAKIKMVLVRIDRQAMLGAFPDNAEVIEKIRPDVEPVADPSKPVKFQQSICVSGASFDDP